MTATRRDVLTFAAGSVGGIFFTPAPWRLITDAALWSENWPGIPRPARGEVRERFTHCALCPAGCAVRARCVGNQPVALRGLPGRPLCASGLTAHHLPYHPERWRAGDAEGAAKAVTAAIEKCRPGESVAVLDLGPGRTASWTYRRAMAMLRKGVYLAPRSMPLAVDLAAARTVLSFGAPVLDGWGTPANVLKAREHFRLIQAEPLASHTAILADTWLPLRPGTEDILALGIAHVLLRQGRAPVDAAFEELAARYPASRAAEITGVPEGQIVEAARQLSANGPALAVAAEDSSVILGLNRLLGAPGRTLFARREAPVPEEWEPAPITSVAAVPDRSIRVLLIDETVADSYIPWPKIQPKLAADPLVIAFAWSRAGYGRHARHVVPAAVFPEILDDLPPAADAVNASFRLAIPLVAPPRGVVHPAEFVARVAGLAMNDPLRERADAIHDAGRGKLISAPEEAAVPVADLTADVFWKGLSEGGRWVDDEAPQPPVKLALENLQPRLLAEEAGYPLAVVACEVRAAGAPPSPLLSKLSQEADLRPMRGRAALHPVTARQYGLEEGCRAAWETRQGRAGTEIGIDPAVPPGVLRVTATAAILDLCGRAARARVVRI